MKLILCRRCQDILKLSLSWRGRRCECGRSGGWYKDDQLTAIIYGPCVVIGFDNPSLGNAVNQVESIGPKQGYRFTAFVISEKADSIERMHAVRGTPRDEKETRFRSGTLEADSDG